MKILFVCLGNICRSPLAEGIFRHLAKGQGVASRFHADSAGTGNWHIGEPPDARAGRTALRNGIRLECVGRQIGPADFEDFDLLLCMDRTNYREVTRLSPKGHRHKIRMLRDFDEEAFRGEDIPDPYYGDAGDFQQVFDIQMRCCRNLLKALRENEVAG